MKYQFVLYIYNFFYYVTMDNYSDALDWKTVFKKILSGSEKSNSSCSLISTEKPNTTVNIQYQERECYENVTYIFSSKISSSSCNNISEDNANQSPSFHELTFDKKSTSELLLEREKDARNNTKLSYNFSENGESNQVPEWNKAFKNILGKNSSIPAMENQNLIPDAIKEKKNLQKCDTSINTRSTPRKNIYKVHKSKEHKNLQKWDTSVNTRSTSRENIYEDPEEDKVRELFALSRMFKHVNHNLNDFDGAGVDIFKCDKNLLSKSFEKSSKVDLTNESESFVPIKGLVAKYIPYTTAELIASPKVPFIEPPWDDDLLM